MCTAQDIEPVNKSHSLISLTATALVPMKYVKEEVVVVEKVLRRLVQLIFAAKTKLSIPGQLETLK